jgi:Xaa-Pro dipeptidase
MIQRVRNIFTNSTQHVDCIVLKNASMPFIDENFFYITDLSQGIFEGSCAILHPDGTLDLLVSELEAESARKSDARLTVYKTKQEFATALKDITASCAKIGVNANGLSHNDFIKLQELTSKIEFVDISDSLFKTRLIKDDQEIHRIKQACALADETMAMIPDVVSEGMSESELAAEINFSLQNQGAEKPAFDTISSFGKNTAEPHYSHGDATLQKGNLVLCDFGACYKKYNSDITRTFVFGQQTEQFKKMYTIVRDAQQIAFDMIKPGVTTDEVHKAVLAFIDSTPFKGRFIHSTGHFLGLSVHDGIGFSSENHIELKERMILTVEPGIYIPGIGGIRIEDDILLRKDGMELLTKSSHDFIELQ